VGLAASLIRAIALLLGAASQTTRRYNPEDSHLRTHRRENLKSYFICTVYYFLARYFLLIRTQPFLIHKLHSPFFGFWAAQQHMLNIFVDPEPMI
jgi:uncharacterized membrane protein